MHFLRDYPLFQDWKALYLNDKLLCICALSLPVLLSLFFFSSTGMIRNIFYASLPLYAALLFRDRLTVRSIITENRFVWGSIAAYLIYMTASVAWSETSEHGRYFEKAKLAPLIFMGTVSASYIAYKCKPLIPTLATCYIAVAIITGIILLIPYAIHVFETNTWPRLSGLGRATNPIQVGILYALAILMALFTKLPDRMSKISYRIGLSVIPFAIILLTQSRGPFLSLCLTIPTILILRPDTRLRQKIKQALFISLIGISLAAGLHAFLKNTDLVERKSTGRTEIWAAAITQFHEKPLIGHGLANQILYMHTFDDGSKEYVRNAHSLYLSTLVQGGMIGLFLFMGMTGAILIKAYRANTPRITHVWPVAFLIFGYFQGFVDFGGYVINLTTEWLVFWWPVALITGYLTNHLTHHLTHHLAAPKDDKTLIPPQ